MYNTVTANCNKNAKALNRNIQLTEKRYAAMMVLMQAKKSKTIEPPIPQTIKALPRFIFMTYPWYWIKRRICKSCSWIKAVEWGHWQGNQYLHQCQTWTEICHSAVSTGRSKIRWCCDYYQQKGWYHQSAHRQSLGKCSHEIKGVRKCLWCWLAENTRTVCQRTPMDGLTDADAYPWGQFHVCWWTEESSWTIQGI